MRAKAINGALQNFLGSIVSRNSDYDGYWLFGLIVRDLNELAIDLLDPKEDTIEDSPSTAVAKLAKQKFTEQITKAGFSMTILRQAELRLTKLPDSQNRWITDRMCIGSSIQFVAKVVTDTGKSFERDVSVIVAPHDPDVENRSIRRNPVND